MKVLLLLIVVSVSLGFCGLLAFIWALRNHQFDDLEGDAERIFFDEEGPRA